MICIYCIYETNYLDLGLQIWSFEMGKSINLQTLTSQNLKTFVLTLTTCKTGSGIS